MSANLVPVEWNRTSCDFGAGAGFHELFKVAAATSPEAVAVSDAERSLSYAELNRASARLAGHLIRRGVSAGARVSLLMERSCDLTTAMLAVARAGAAYVPLDPAYPEQRLRYMLEDSRTSLVITQGDLLKSARGLIGEQCDCLALDLWREQSADDAEDAQESLRTPTNPDSLAYILYTSGSTGAPKGVMISHRALTNFLQATALEPGIKPGETLLAVTTHCFDISGLELLSPLIVGGRCRICPTSVAGDADRLMALINEVEPDVMQATPATWTMLAHAGWTNPRQMRVLCGGEPMPEALKQFFDETCEDVWNMFGPTETTIWSTVYRLRAGRPVSIGKPIANTRIHIVREDMSLCEIGEPGELCIAGDGLAHGYLNKPALTAEKFVANPFEESGCRLYRTGDLACWNAEGLILHMGRIDNQVKIRGHRVEVGEIEAHLDSHPDIVRSVVTPRAQAPGQLVAYFVAQPNAQPERLTAPALKAFLAERLPNYMVPGLILPIDSIPSTPNGKTDRKALSERPISASGASRTETRSKIEAFICEQWRALLGVEDVQVDSDFLDIGGDSISANAFLAKLNKRFAVHLDLTALANHATPAAIARKILERQGVLAAKQTGTRPSAAPGLDRQPASDAFSGHAQRRQGSDDRKDVAIVGMAGAFPEAPTLDRFWDNIVDGRNCIRAVRDARPELASSAQWGGFIDGVFDFDPAFFRISPREAELMDPQQRLMLMCVWHAFEDAAIPPETFSERRAGVFVAISQNTYALEAAERSGNLGYLVTGHFASMAPNRISFILDLRGPSECVEATCSSSLVALHRAVCAIRNGECDQAVAGGVNLLLSASYFDSYRAMGLLSADQTTRSFQTSGEGYVRSEGVAAVILKPLSQALADNDRIHAVIKGSSVNHGGRAASLTAPSKDGICSAVMEALRDAGAHPETIGYLETHATGSVTGDDVEVDALRAAFAHLSGDRPLARPCFLGSLKPCIGHAEVASGMAALVKGVLALRHGVIPGVPGVRGDEISTRWPNAPFRLSAKSRNWPTTSRPRRMGINSYGFGVNAHVVLEEHRPGSETVAVRNGQDEEGGAPSVAVFSARTAAQLQTLLERMRDMLPGEFGGLRDLAYTLQTGRQSLPVRLAVLAQSLSELERKLEQAIALVSGAGLDPTTAATQGIFYSGARKTAPSIDDPGPIANDFSPAGPEELAARWVNGAAVDWAPLHAGSRPRKCAAPLYPFARKEHRAPREGVASQPQIRRDRKKRICVVGAGPGGLVMAKSLLEEGHQPVVFEAQDALGGVWTLKREKIAGAYATTRFQNSKDTSFFSDFYPTDIAETFPDVGDVRRYLEQYADHFGLKPLIQLHSRIVSVSRSGDRWRVEIDVDGARRTETFDGVALCHGRYQKPRRPEIKGLDAFPGQVLHSGQYFDNSLFIGKRVLVIGNGVSGMDIAAEASKVAASVHWSIRSRKFILPRMVGFLPNDFVSPANLLMPEKLRAQRNLDHLALAAPTFSESFERTGLRPSLEEFREQPFIHINDEVLDLVAAGRIAPIFGQVDRFVDDACYHKGRDAALQNIDIVVLCTGYDSAALFQYLRGIDPYKDLAMGLFHRDDPLLVNQYGLQEIGVVGTFPYLEMVSRWYAQIASGAYQLSPEERALDADVDQIIMGPLASVMIGLKLGLAPDPRSEFRAFWALLSSPCFPAQYRLRGPHASPEAQAIVDASRKRAFIHDEARDPEIRNVKFRILAGLGTVALDDLLRRQEITADEHEEALLRLDDPLLLDWGSQFLTPVQPAADASPPPTIETSPPLDDDRIEYLTLVRLIKERKVDSGDFLSELQKLSRAS